MSVNLSIPLTPYGWQQSGQPGNPQGFIATDPLSGVGVSIPFETSQTSLDTAGSATCALQSSGIASNSDGSCTGINMSVPAYNGTQQMARIWFRFTGSFLKLRWLVGNTSVAFSGKVDGRAFYVPAQDLYLNAEQRPVNDGENHVLIFDGLRDDIIHHCVITLPSPASGTSTLLVYGMVVDSKAGYLPLPRCTMIVSTANLTASLADVNLGSSLNTAKGFHAIDYSNNDVSSVSALTSSSTTATGTVASNSGMVVGMPVVISGATQTEYNGTFAIASLVSTTGFTYTFAGSATTPATGTITAAWKYHLVTMNYNGSDDWTKVLGPKGAVNLPNFPNTIIPLATATYPETPRGLIKPGGSAANWQHKADTTAVVRANVIGGF
jgi:hypothetical protein